MGLRRMVLGGDGVIGVMFFRAADQQAASDSKCCAHSCRSQVEDQPVLRAGLGRPQALISGNSSEKIMSLHVPGISNQSLGNDALHCGLPRAIARSCSYERERVD